MTNKPTETKRLFFALWPDENVVRKINQHAIKYFSVCQGRLLKKSNWHITLAYFGNADRKTQYCLEQQADKIKVESFKLSLGKCGYWKKPAVAWLVPSDIPKELQQLVVELQQNLTHCGYKPEERDYQPHVTLVRKAKQPPSIDEIEAIPWIVNKFCLVESITGEGSAVYTVLKEWEF